ncbi:MAG: OmpA family protein [Flavobacteriaceae bacterium]|nr:OmpA family protein [Flavobacteriaceae bacterium]
MKFTKYIILFFVAFLFSNLSSAQVKKLKEADKMFENYAFIDAQEIYLEVAEAGYKSENLFKKLGDSYYFNSNLAEAHKWYEKLFELNENPSEHEYFYRYSQSLRSIEAYEKADKYMKTFENLTGSEDSRVTRIKSEANYLELIELQSGKFEIEKLEINSDLSDFSPRFVGDSLLIFSSNRNVSKAVQRIHEWNNQPYLNLYQVNLDDSLNTNGTPEFFLEELSSKFHEASATLTKDGKTVYFTRNNFDNKKLVKSQDGYNYLKIYKSKKQEDGSWTSPKELPFCSDEFNTAHPALSPNEDKLYFASDGFDSLGMSDLFYVDINGEDDYGAPVNLGPDINTEGKESFPFISEDGLLYFSSNGHVGLGGYDVFVSSPDTNNSFGEPFNLGRPINSSKDDFSFIINDKRGIGFFSSNRNEDNIDQLYRAILNDDLITRCQQYLEGKISENTTSKGIEGVQVELLDDELNSIGTKLTDVNGDYSFEVECNKRYVVRITKEGYKTFESLVKTSDNYENSVLKDMSLEQGNELGVKQVKEGDDLRDILQLDPIYFELDEFGITNEAEVELEKVLAVLRNYPDMKIDIRSHTDSRAGDAYNKILSDKRAKATINYLVNKGIESNRVSGKGYGETQLVNHCANNVDCSEEEHALNRRSEFIILNKNETPEDLRKKLADKYNQSIDQRNKATNKSSTSQLRSRANSVGNSYDFNSSEEVYTVQVGAFGKEIDTAIEAPDVFFYSYKDGFVRYFSGVFRSREEANKHKNYLLQKGLEGVFTVGLKGQSRF